MPHGDMSDIAALVLIVGGIAHMATPSVLFDELGPLPAAYEGEMTAQVEGILRMMGGFILTVGFMLTTVRWNPTNGKLAGIGCIVAGVNVGYTALGFDSGAFVFRPTYILAAICVIAGLHTIFNPNPMPPKAAKAQQ